MLKSWVANHRNLYCASFGIVAMLALTATTSVLADTTTPIAAAVTVNVQSSDDDSPYGNLPSGSDAQFSALFSSWKKMDAGSTARTLDAVVFIPSGRPVISLALTSNFGVRRDPFNGSARMHKGIDIPGPVGTPIYATADGIVGRAQWVNGYGNFIELSHGSGLETRYGHLSRLAVYANERVRRGQLIGYMGSTGRSTGSHLHYEVRVDGEAVNPMPFTQGSNYLVSLKRKAPIAHGMTPSPVAMGGPTSSQETIAD